jgi:Zn-dependent protease
VLAGPSSTVGQRPLFRAFGLPVHVRPGFFAFLLLAAIVNGGAFGLWLSISIGLLTLTHELGHALVARRFGAEAEISLDMLAGYTSYAPTRPMQRWQRALVAFSGPVAEIVPGVVALLALGANPFSLDSVGDTPLRKALWFAGPVLGLFNLLPVLPLDGGNIVALGLDAVLPGRGRQIWLWISIGGTAVAMAVLFSDRDLRPLALYSAMLLFLQFQTLRGDRRYDREKSAARASVEVRATKMKALEQLMSSGQVLDAARRGAELFGADRDPAVAMVVARAAARLGETATSAAWVQAAAHAAHDPSEVLYEFDHHVDLAVLHGTPATVALRRTLGG